MARRPSVARERVSRLQSFGCREGVPVLAAKSRIARAGGRRGDRLADAAAGRSCELRGSRARRASPAASRMGAPARAQRRLRGARDSLRRRVVRVHRRHRQRGGAVDRLIVRPCAHSRPQGASPRQRDFELAAVSDALRPDMPLSRRTEPVRSTRGDRLERYETSARQSRTDQDGAVSVNGRGHCRP